jgi:hypothetical protein
MDTNKACPYSRRRKERSHRLRWRMIMSRIVRIASRYRLDRAWRTVAKTLTCFRWLKKRG